MTMPSPYTHTDKIYSFYSVFHKFKHWKSVLQIFMWWLPFKIAILNMSWVRKQTIDLLFFLKRPRHFSDQTLIEMLRGYAINIFFTTLKKLANDYHHTVWAGTKRCLFNGSSTMNVKQIILYIFFSPPSMWMKFMNLCHWILYCRSLAKLQAILL